MPTLRLRLSRIFLLGVALLFSSFMIMYYYYRTAGPLAEPQMVLFKKGMGFEEIVEHMADKKVIRYPFLFKAIAVVKGDARKFKAGQYRFSSAISPRLIMGMVADGHVVVHKITIAEGLTTQQMLELLRKNKRLEGEIADDIKEGSLLPQTYHFTYGDTRQEVVDRMQAAMDSTLDQLWPRRDKKLPIKTKLEALTLASIVEKETGLSAERGRVAAVFINRLNIGMRLQTDPTVIYAIERVQGKMKRSLVRSDMQYDSPYNTYKYAGLPPGPIANPGRRAIKAVLNPPKTKELYFVATGKGGHHFSTTLKQHNEYVRQYRKVLREK